MHIIYLKYVKYSLIYVEIVFIPNLIYSANCIMCESSNLL